MNYDEVLRIFILRSIYELIIYVIFWYYLEALFGNLLFQGVPFMSAICLDYWPWICSLSLYLAAWSLLTSACPWVWFCMPSTELGATSAHHQLYLARHISVLLKFLFLAATPCPCNPCLTIQGCLDTDCARGHPCHLRLLIQIHKTYYNVVVPAHVFECIMK